MPKTTFEQVSLEVVKKVVEEQLKQQERASEGIKKKELEQSERLLLTNREANEKGRQK
jgi:hypothetical protein